MANLFAKLGLGLIFCLVSFLPIIGVATILDLSSLCVLSMFAIIIIFTAIISDDSAVILMDSFSDEEFAAEKIKECSFCGEKHADEDCHYMVADDLLEGGFL